MLTPASTVSPAYTRARSPNVSQCWSRLLGWVYAANAGSAEAVTTSAWYSKNGWRGTAPVRRSSGASTPSPTRIRLPAIP